MSVLDTKHKKKSMTITVILHVIILILLFYFGFTYLDPPPENGIAVNFGTTDTGRGNVQPTEKIQSAPNQNNPEPVQQPKSEIKEEVVTQDTEDAPVIKKEETKKEQKETPKKVEPKKQPPKKPDPKPDKSTSDALSSLINGPKSDGTAQLTFEFTDGDGDIGLNPRDTLNPYNPGNKYYYNVFVEYYELQNGVWTLIPITNPPLYYRSPVVTPKGQNKTLNGSMTIDLPFYHNPASSFDTIKLSMQLVDRALNESNIVETSAIVKP